MNSDDIKNLSTENLADVLNMLEGMQEAVDEMIKEGEKNDK